MQTNGASVHYRACNLCEAMCGIAVEHRDGRVLGIVGDPEDLFSRGHICPKAVALADIHEDPDRLRRPLRRRGRDFEEIGWEQALEEVVARLHEIRTRHGRHAVGVYIGNPTVHNYGSLLYAGLLLPMVLRTRNRYSATSVDQLPRMLVSLLMYGNQLLMPVPDLDRSSYVLMLGANPAVSNGSIMTAPDVVNRLKDLRRRGGKLVVIDPRRTETAELADEHHFIVPGRDAFFLLGVLHTLFDEGLARPGRLEPHLEGMDEVRAMASRFAPEAMADVCGMPAATIRRLAREIAAAPGGVCYGRMGVSVQEFGALATWLIDLVNVVTGNLDRAGGSMFTTPALDLVRLGAKMGQRGSFGRWRSRVRGLPEFSGELPVATLADEIETPGASQIRALLTVAGNPVLSAPNGARIERALEGLELMVSVDIYCNETTRHADYILPPTSALEHENYDLALHLLAVRNTTRFSPKLFEAGPEARHDWQIFLELMARLTAKNGLSGRFKGALMRAAGRAVTPERFVDLCVRLGPHGDRFNPFSDGLSLRKIKAAPHGIDLGPLQPRLPEALYTGSRKVRLAPPELTADLGRLEARLAAMRAEAAAPEAGQRPLLLISRRQLRSNNSWMHNSLRMVRGRRRCTLLMHPQDAAGRGLHDGQTVRLGSRAGSIEVQLEVSGEVMPGVVSLPHGWGHDRPGVRLAVAAEHAGASVNDVTDELLVDAMSGNAALSGVPVTVAAAEAVVAEAALAQEVGA